MILQRKGLKRYVAQWIRPWSVSAVWDNTPFFGETAAWFSKARTHLKDNPYLSRALQMNQSCHKTEPHGPSPHLHQQHVVEFFRDVLCLSR